MHCYSRLHGWAFVLLREQLGLAQRSHPLEEALRWLQSGALLSEVAEEQNLFPQMLVFPLWETDESVQIPDCCFLKEAVWVCFVFFFVCLFVWFFFFLGKIGKEALICIINFVVIHIFEQPRERNPEPVPVGTQGRRADRF